MHPLLASFRRNEWATLALLNFCGWQPPESIGETAADVYGAIEPMFNHLAGAEVRYLKLLTGEEPAGSVHEKNAPRRTSDLAEPIRSLAARWIALLQEERDIEAMRTHDRPSGRSTMPDWLLIAQALHHGDDHRAQIGTMLGRAGRVILEIDGWQYALQPHYGEPDVKVASWADAQLRHCVEHHLWAMDGLLESCQKLDAGQLQLSAAGTYGTLLATLEHLVTSDAGYLSRLRRGPRIEHLEATELGPVVERWQPQRDAWLSYLDGSPDFESKVECSDGWYPSWVLVIQALHHGHDHRAHAGTVFLANGLELPDLDVWSYAWAVGQLQEAPAG